MTSPILTVLELLRGRGMNLSDGYHKVMETDYISAGLVDSLSLLRFVIELEDAFKVTFTDAEVASPEFRTVGGLVALLERKIGPNIPQPRPLITRPL